jgi:hypothetical protein
MPTLHPHPEKAALRPSRRMIESSFYKPPFETPPTAASQGEAVRVRFHACHR